MEHRFSPQALDQHVDDVRHRLVGRVPDVLGDRGTADHLSGVEGQELEERKLTRRQIDWLIVAAGLARAEVEAQVADGEHRGVTGNRPRRMTARRRASSSPKSNGLMR